MKFSKKLFASQRIYLTSIIVGAIIVGFGVSFLFAMNKNDTVVKNVACEGTCVSLFGKTASPDTFAVTVGTYVTFNSADGKSHELTLGDAGSHSHSNPGSYESGVFNSDESFKLQFKEEGTYTFTDKMNPETTIVVIVYTEGKDYKVQ